MKLEDIQNQIAKYFKEYRPESRSITLYTGIGGIDLFETVMEVEMGFKRVKIGNKVMRILRKLNTPIKKSISGEYYKLVKTNGKVL